MSMSRTKLLTSLRQLHQQRRAMLRRLTRDQELALGTVSMVYRKCGNPRCHCVEGRGHPQTLFLFKDEQQGRRRCKLVRREDEVRMNRAGQRYRQFRDDLKELRAIDKEEKRILMALAKVRAIRYQ